MFCAKCGHDCGEGVTFCPSCGNAMAAPQQPPVQQQPVQQQPPVQNQMPPQQQSYQQPPQQQTPYQQAPGQPPYQQQPMARTDNSKMYCILSYLGIFWLIGMLANPEKNDPKVRFHVGQGMILAIFSAGLSIVSNILFAILRVVFTTTTTSYYGYSYTTVSPIVGILSGLVGFAIFVVFAIFAIMGIMNANNGRMNRLPIIGNFAFYK